MNFFMSHFLPMMLWKRQNMENLYINLKAFEFRPFGALFYSIYLIFANTVYYQSYESLCMHFQMKPAGRHPWAAYRPPGGWPPSGRILCFQLLLISNDISIYTWSARPWHSPEAVLGRGHRCGARQELFVSLFRVEGRPLIGHLIKICN
jgi:hypothetical protein